MSAANRLLYIMVDVESTGPVPPLYSMVEIGAVAITPSLEERFHCEIQPLPEAGIEAHIPQLLGRSLTEMKQRGLPPGDAMYTFSEWLTSLQDSFIEPVRPRFVSDNPGFDFAFINYYFHRFHGRNPFGWSSVNLANLYHGARRSMQKSFRHLRRTKHTHHALDDALGNAEAFVDIANTYEMRSLINSGVRLIKQPESTQQYTEQSKGVAINA